MKEGYSMIECKNCQTLNEKDAVFCKRCGANLYVDNPNTEHVGNDQNMKAKKKTKVKKEKRVKRKRARKEKLRRSKTQNVEEKRGMTFFQKILMGLLLLFVIALLGVAGYMGYDKYHSATIVVPDVTGMGYEEAALQLIQADLKVRKKEQLTSDQTKNDIVLAQDKKAGCKVSAKTQVILTVGVRENQIIMPSIVGEQLDVALTKLNELGISYEITYEEYENSGIVLKQSEKAGKELRGDDVVTLVVSKKKTTVHDVTPTPTSPTPTSTPTATPTPENTPGITPFSETE